MSEELKIESGFPIPKANTKRGRWRALLEKMRHGDSVVTTRAEAALCKLRPRNSAVRLSHKPWATIVCGYGK